MSLPEFGWLGLVGLAALWVVTVFLAVRFLDWLFPRIKHSAEDTAMPLDPATWYPLPPRALPRTARLASPVSLVDPAYWRTNLKIIAVLLVMWIAASVIPVALSPWLNQFRILTGFPLGYYFGAQGSLIIFLALTFAYIWRAARLDEKFRVASKPVESPEAAQRYRRQRLIFLAFVLGFVAFLVILSSWQEALHLSDAAVGWAFFIVMIGLYAVIGLRNRAHSLEEYFVAGRRVPAFFNGLAVAGDWMSAASFISMAGTLWLLGYEGLAYIMGWTGGYVVLALLLAPYLRRFGQFTIPDFVGARYGGSIARVVSATIGILISFTYVTAQVAGIGIIMSRFLGVNYLVGVGIGLGAVLFCSFLGGMRAITWTQVTQCVVLVIAYLVPVTILSARSTGIPFPQVMYGTALDQIVRLETLDGIAKSYVEPFNDWTPWNFIALMFCLMLGTAGMPHILVRFYTVPNADSARKSVGWALVFICMLYFTAPAYAAFSRWQVLENLIGKRITSVPEWAVNWSNAGLLSISDQDGDGILQYDELKIDPDVVVLATPEIAGLSGVVTALVAAGGLAAALSTADGLLMVIASALAHDIYARTINPLASARSRLLLGRLMIFLAALAAGFAATRRLGIIVQLVAWAFSFAAATIFPILVMGIFWKRANSQGAVAGMLAGLVVTLVYMILNSLNPQFNILGITHVAAGVFGILTNFAVTLLTSRLTPATSEETKMMVEALRQP